MAVHVDGGNFKIEKQAESEGRFRFRVQFSPSGCSIGSYKETISIDLLNAGVVVDRRSMPFTVRITSPGLMVKPMSVFLTTVQPNKAFEGDITISSKTAITFDSMEAFDALSAEAVSSEPHQVKVHYRLSSGTVIGEHLEHLKLHVTVGGKSRIVIVPFIYYVKPT